MQERRGEEDVFCSIKQRTESQEEEEEEREEKKNKKQLKLGKWSGRWGILWLLLWLTLASLVFQVHRSSSFKISLLHLAAVEQFCQSLLCLRILSISLHVFSLSGKFFRKAMVQITFCRRGNWKKWRQQDEEAEEEGKREG